MPLRGSSGKHPQPWPPLARAVGATDDVVGAGVERAVRAHHRRRLRRIGWEQALDAAPGLVAPRAYATSAGNEVDVFIDGASALPAIAAAIRGAQRSVWLAGWFFSPTFELVHEPARIALADLLHETASRGVAVRLLAWAGAPLPLFRPSRKTVESALAELAAGHRVRVAADSHERPLHCHHEKLVIVDGVEAFVGGIDLTDLGGDRFDGVDHPRRSTVGWHDAAMALRGPAVADVAAHFALRWHEVTGERLATAEPSPDAGPLTVQVVRTVPEGIYTALPAGDFSLLAAYAGALRAARSLIYLENQFLWSSELVEILAAQLRDPPSDAFRIVIVLPGHPNNGADDTSGQLGVLRDADSDGRLLACTLVARGDGPPQPVYVHAKIGIVDDLWLTLGSANLNEHSLFNDTEVNLAIADPVLAADTRRRLWAEHLELTPGAVAGDPATLIDERWRPIAVEQRARRDAGAPLTHRLVEMPDSSRRSRRLLGPIQSLLVDG